MATPGNGLIELHLTTPKEEMGLTLEDLLVIKPGQSDHRFILIFQARRHRRLSVSLRQPEFRNPRPPDQLAFWRRYSA